MKKWISENRITLFVMGVLLIVFAASVLRSYILNGGYSVEWEMGFWQNFGTEVLGAMATFVLIERVINQDIEKKSLLLQLRSPDNGIALNALEEIKDNNWHKDGSLKKVNLEKANLERADLSNTVLEMAKLYKANLQYVNLQEANLQEANLEWANLMGAKLWGANLINAKLCKSNLSDTNLSWIKALQADLRDANLNGAELEGANLEGANLGNTNLYLAGFQKANLGNSNLSGARLEYAIFFDANLSGADLSGADLTRAKLEQARFSIETILPNGDKWTVETDISKFTNPNHLNFFVPPSYLQHTDHAK